MDYNKINYDEYADSYSLHRNASDRVISHIFDIIKNCHINKTLEVGCGTADHLYLLRKKLGFEGYGFDRSAEMLKEGMKKNPGLLLTTGDANQSFPYGPSIFDFVYSVNVIHYISNPKQYFNEAYRVMKESGIVLTVTANTDKMKESICKYFPEFESNNSRSSKFVDGITKSMKVSGFEKVHTTYTDYEHKLEAEDMEPIENKVFAWVRLLSDRCFENGVKLMKKDIEDGIAIGGENFIYIWGVKK